VRRLLARLRGREDERVAAARSAHARVYGAFPAEWNEIAEFRVHGIVSHHFLRDYAWTIDFARMTMTFVPPTPG